MGLLIACGGCAVLAVAFVVMMMRATKLNSLLGEERMRTRFLEERLEERKGQEEAMRLAARAEFENLAARVIERETLKFQETSEKGLERMLTPLKERLRDFEKKVDDSYQAEGRERHVLKSEVEKLIQLNDRMTRETSSLTQALKGDSKTQGDWGEMVLESVLESAGLREGLEFLKQETLEGEDGEKYRPDVLIKLPDDKQIIVDSKVSLKAYEAHSRAETDVERAAHLRAHVESLNSHVNDLAEKHYPKLKGLRTPEFVFLFTPIESAYVMAMRHDPELATRAWRKGVAIVTATTLFTSLKTVASIWRLENQNRNAQDIAQEAGRLYDKFVGFYEDFEKVGRLLENGMTQYEEARRKLRDGSGNVFKKMENLRELGASPNKKIRPELLE